MKQLMKQRDSLKKQTLDKDPPRPGPSDLEGHLIHFDPMVCSGFPAFSLGVAELAVFGDGKASANSALFLAPQAQTWKSPQKKGSNTQIGSI